MKKYVKVIYPFRMYGEYADGFTTEVGGWDEGHCMDKLLILTDVHGDLIYYTGVNDEDYVDGEYVGVNMKKYINSNVALPEIDRNEFESIASKYLDWKLIDFYIDPRSGVTIYDIIYENNSATIEFEIYDSRWDGGTVRLSWYTNDVSGNMRKEAKAIHDDVLDYLNTL